jgi:hypothetical protein
VLFEPPGMSNVFFRGVSTASPPSGVLHLSTLYHRAISRFFFRRQPRTQTAEFRVDPPLPTKASVSHQPPSTVCPSTVYFRRPPLYQPQLAMSAFNSIPGSPPTGQQRRSSAILVMSPVQTAKNNDAAS